VIDTRDVLYFVSITILFLSFTVYNLKSSNFNGTNLKKTNLKSVLITNFTDYKHNRKPVFYRFDLTKDRYTSSTSLDIVKQVKEPLYIKIYLQGDLPAEFIRLQRRRSSFGRISSL
jgi:hypothetical protein